MKLFLVEKVGCIGYDEFDAFVVAAEDADAAVALTIEEHHTEGVSCWAGKEDLAVTELGEETEAAIILGSFNEG